MWPRLSEIALALWLVAAGIVFPSESWRVVEVAAASALIVLALVSLLTPLRKAHLASFAVAVGLMGSAYMQAPLGSGSQQNAILVGLVLAMLAILPNEINRPPRPWRDYLRPKD